MRFFLLSFNKKRSIFFPEPLLIRSYNINIYDINIWYTCWYQYISLNYIPARIKHCIFNIKHFFLLLFFCYNLCEFENISTDMSFTSKKILIFFKRSLIKKKHFIYFLKKKSIRSQNPAGIDRVKDT